MPDFLRRQDQHFSLGAPDILTSALARPRFQSVLNVNLSRSDVIRGHIQYK